MFPVYLQNVHIHIVDMSSARQVWEFANNFSHTVHVLVGGTKVCWFVCKTHRDLNVTSRWQINNAGCMVNQRELTDEGLEKNFATNTLGKIHYIVK